MVQSVPGVHEPETPGKDREEASFLQQVTIRQGGRLFAVAAADIVWLEAANQYVRIHTLSGSHLLSRSLNALEKQLDPQKFFRIHRSAIAHVTFIKEVRTAGNGTFSVLLATGDTLKLSRGRRGILTDLLKHCS
jgi:two-component system LytT family response regulator